MPSNSDKDRQLYLEKIKVYKDAIDVIIKWETEALESLDPEDTGSSAISKRFKLVEKMLDATSYYVILNSISQSTLKKINEDALGDARKFLTKGLGYLEDLVSHYVDAPFSDYDDKISLLVDISVAKRYALIRKLGLTIMLFKSSFRDDSKWKWTFVEIDGRFAAVTKNLFDFKKINENTTHGSPNYAVSMYHLKLLKRLLNDAADRYRERYEMSTNHTDDFEASLNFMKALRRIHIILNEAHEAEIIKKKLDVWEAKLKADMLKKEEEKANS